MPRPFLSVTLLPSAHGDGIWIEYSSGARTHRIVIDGGPLKAYGAFASSFDRLPAGDKPVELFVITHVDLDHIEAPLKLLVQRRQQWPFEPGDIWFNGYRHMTRRPVLGALQGEFLGAVLERSAPRAWNRAFGGNAVVVPDQGDLPRISLPDGMALTLLSPDRSSLTAMADVWRSEITKFKAGDIKRAWKLLAQTRRYQPAKGILGVEDLDEVLRRQLTGGDDAKANGTSIAFLAEFQGKSILLLADAHMPTVCSSIRRLLPLGENCLTVDAVKVAHHGSRRNMSLEFLKLVKARHFLFSSDGGGKNHHPHKPVVKAIAKAMDAPTLWFNYRSPDSEPWELLSKVPGARFVTRYPVDNQAGIQLKLL